MNITYTSITREQFNRYASVVRFEDSIRMGELFRTMERVPVLDTLITYWEQKLK